MFIVFSIFLGLIMGLITAIFGIVLLYVSSVRDSHTYLIAFLPIIGAIVFYAYITYANRLRAGMKMVKSAYEGDSNISRKLIPFITISTWLSHLFGASVGREGVAVQIGAAFSNLTYKKFKVEKKDAILAGMASGFSGLFGTPLTAIIFPIEIMFNRKKDKITIKTVIMIVLSSFIASFTSHYLGLPHFKFFVEEKFGFSVKLIFIIIFASLMFSLAAILFNRIIKLLKPHFSANVRTVFLLSIILAIIIYFFRDARYAGLGTNLISMSFTDGGQSINNFDFIFKLLLTCFSLSLSFQGGEVTPLFAIGASLGVTIAVFFNAPVYLLAAIGYAVVFSGSTNTLITPILIGYEVFGIHVVPYLILASLLVYIFTGKNSIY